MEPLNSRGLREANAVETGLRGLLDQLKAISDETRLKVFKLLQSREELCVCEIVEAVGLAQPTVSVHLAKLKRAGLVKDRRVGQWSYHSVDRDGLSAFGDRLDRFLRAAPADIPEMRDIVARIDYCEDRDGSDRRNG